MPTLRADPSLLPSACPTQQARVGGGRTSVGCRPGRWGATTRHYSASTLASHRPVGIQDSGTQESVTRPPVSSALHCSPGALPKAWRIGEPLGAGANWRIESRSKGRVPPGPRLSLRRPPPPNSASYPVPSAARREVLWGRLSLCLHWVGCWDLRSIWRGEGFKVNSESWDFSPIWGPRMGLPIFNFA